MAGKIAYVKKSFYADEYESGQNYSNGGKWLNPGQELTYVGQTDKGVMFKGGNGKTYHVDFYDCDTNLSSKKQAHDGISYGEHNPTGKCRECGGPNYGKYAVCQACMRKHPTSKAHDRASLHAALDAVLDHGRARDAGRVRDTELNEDIMFDFSQNAKTGSGKMTPATIARALKMIERKYGVEVAAELRKRYA